MPLTRRQAKAAAKAADTSREPEGEASATATVSDGIEDSSTLKRRAKPDKPAKADGRKSHSDDDHHLTSLSSATTNASLNSLLQLFFRLATFVSNAIILRHSSHEMLGIANVRLMLLYSTVLFLGRESLLKASLSTRRYETNAAVWHTLVNLCWYSVPVGVVFAVLLGACWSQLLPRPDAEYYDVGVVAFGTAAVIELASLPILAVDMIHLRTTRRIVAEGLAVTVRCAIALVLVLYQPELGLRIPSLAQLAYSATFSAWLVLNAGRDIRSKTHPVFKTVADMFPRAIGGRPWYLSVNKHTAGVAWSFFQHSILKQLLTEGERYLMTLFGLLTFGQQGIYDVVHNLGSLVARFLFHPVEENFYTFFASLLHRHDEHSHHDANEMNQEGEDDSDDRHRSSEQTAELPARATKGELTMANDTFRILLKAMLVIGAVFAVFGQAYSALLLFLYGGSALSSSEGPVLLQTYSVYVLTMAINGISECFVSAASSKAAIDHHNRLMVVFSVVFVASTAILTSAVGTPGFILANCVNMALRGGHSLHMIHRYYHAQPLLRDQPSPLAGLVLHPMVVMALLLGLAASLTSEMHFAPVVAVATPMSLLMHVGVGIGALLLFMVALYLEEASFLRELHALFIARKRRPKVD